MSKSTQIVAMLVAFLAGYFVSFRMYATRHFMIGNHGRGSISMPVWRVDNTPAHRALMTFYGPLRALPWYDAPVEWY
jgi:hypothetical protein